MSKAADSDRTAGAGRTVDSDRTEGSGSGETQKQASPVAGVLAEVVAGAGFPKQAALDLERLLGHSLAAPNVGELRYARIGLLVDLINDGSGEYPTEEQYEELRAKRAAAGEDWPSAAQLRAAYGRWVKAVFAAARFWFDGGKARVPRYYKQGPKERGYEPQEILKAINHCHRTEGREKEWPEEWEFEEWVRVSRRLAQRAGKPTRFPGMVQVRKAFGTYDTALEAAKRWASGALEASDT